MRDIIVIRNVLIHGYDGIEHCRVWDISHSSLPGLRTIVKDILEGFSG